MKQPNITTGPWKAYPPNEATYPSEYWEVEDTAGHTATVYGNDSEGKANARAIAALPELLAALEQWDAAAQEIADSLYKRGYHPDRANILIDDTRHALVKAGYQF